LDCKFPCVVEKKRERIANPLVVSFVIPQWTGFHKILSDADTNVAINDYFTASVNSAPAERMTLNGSNPANG
jgi:hypothetical protein